MLLLIPKYFKIQAAPEMRGYPKQQEIVSIEKSEQSLQRLFADSQSVCHLPFRYFDLLVDTTDGKGGKMGLQLKTKQERNNDNKTTI